MHWLLFSPALLHPGLHHLPGLCRHLPHRRPDHYRPGAAPNLPPGTVYRLWSLRGVLPGSGLTARHPIRPGTTTDSHVTPPCLLFIQNVGCNPKKLVHTDIVVFPTSRNVLSEQEKDFMTNAPPPPNSLTYANLVDVPKLRAFMSPGSTVPDEPCRAYADESR